MDNLYKAEITKLLEEPSWDGFFKVPPSRAREYSLTLKLKGRDCRADYCYDLNPEGKLFIEDDEAKTALNNLVKYWRWCPYNSVKGPVYLIHIIGATDNVYLDHCTFLQKRIEVELESYRFKYYPLAIGEGQWHAHENWIPRVKSVLESIIREHPSQAT